MVIEINKGGIGVGSASIVLVFAVLCLTIFSLISFIVTQNTKALVNAEAELVMGYYKADTEAEKMLAEILRSETIPSSIQGISINKEDNFDSAGTVYFSYPLHNSDSKAIFVHLEINDSNYRILSWRLIDTEEWVAEAEVNVFRR